MRAVRLSEDVVTVSEFKAHAADLLERAAKTGAPVVVTQNGKPAGVFLSPRAYDDLTERARFIAAVEEGLADSESDRGIPIEDVRKRLVERRRR